jgi:hypothetical protein
MASALSRDVGAKPIVTKLAKFANVQFAASLAPSVPSGDFSIRGGFRGCFGLRLRCRPDRLGRDFESILVHIESLFPVQAFDKLTRRLGDGSRKTRRIQFDRRFHRCFIAIPVPKLHLKRFHGRNLHFLNF